MANHQNVTDGEQEQPDSFVERRLRERLKSVQQALEKAREKLAQHSRQQEQADAELQDARAKSQQQQAELQLLQQQNTELAARLPAGVAHALLASAHGAMALAPPHDVGQAGGGYGSMCGSAAPEAAGSS